METTSQRLLWRIAGPMIILSAVLVSLGILSAWNVYRHQRYTSDLIVREVHSIVAVEKLNLALREIRYLMNLYLRTYENRHLDSITKIHLLSDKLLQRAKMTGPTEEERNLLERVELNYEIFFDRYSELIKSKDSKKELESLSDNFLSKEVLQPLEDYVQANESVVDRTNALGRETANQLAIGMLLLGLCGGAAGVLSGVAMARAVGRSIVQLNVSVQSVASRLSNIKAPVSFTHFGGNSGIQANLKALEEDIEEVIQAFQKNETALLRSEQLARVGQMAAGLAHELRNPLMPMKMLVQAALYKVDKEEPFLEGIQRDSIVNSVTYPEPSIEKRAYLSHRSLQILNDEILRLEQTIQSFLDFARPSKPRRELQDIKELLKGSTQFLSTRMESLNIEMKIQVPDDPVMARVDKNQIRQLFLNLLQNAIDAMPGGGTLTVSLVPGLVISVAFRDTGPGVPEDILDQIFEPFVTTKETGTGLGLSICRQIAMAHGGDLTARNDQGAVFELTIQDTALTESGSNIENNSNRLALSLTS